MALGWPVSATLRVRSSVCAWAPRARPAAPHPTSWQEMVPPQCMLQPPGQIPTLDHPHPCPHPHPHPQLCLIPISISISISNLIPIPSSIPILIPTSTPPPSPFPSPSHPHPIPTPIPSPALFSILLLHFCPLPCPILIPISDTLWEGPVWAHRVQREQAWLSPGRCSMCLTPLISISN